MGDDIRRISVRFYMNKARDVAAYEKLLEIAKKKDCSCNELLIELINQYQENEDNTNEMAECIADIVVARIEKHLSEMGKLVDVKDTSEDTNANADGPVEIGDDALSFISSF